MSVELKQRVSVDEVWQWLGEVPDPEIPVVSVVDLGIVRSVDFSQDECVVTITPTYSGCPATAVIAIEIEEALRRRGLEKVRVQSKLSPAWTTDWIAQSGHEKLLAYGIAPPQNGATCAGGLVVNAPAACPQCGSKNVEEISRFGSTPCKASWRCTDCLEPFDYFKSF